MKLKRLELSGFKSFARSAVLEFPVPVSAIVGPNGSGKSNVAEAIRWVLGEQSLKSLRGRRGEDLIFNGSANSPRLGKASASLVFDNSDGTLPLDFPEVKVERRIFRDGAGEYLLNDSAVRLKDIIELVARIGLGENKHNIIGQGEVDRWLLSSPRDRKEILEEALGLKVYQMKKTEAERKLAATEENMREVESLLRELAPHLKFLKHQAEKAKTRNELEAELTHLERVYFAKRSSDIETVLERIKKEASPLEEARELAERKTREIQEKIVSRESRILEDPNTPALEKETAELEIRRRELERKAGRIEGRAAVLRERAGKPIARIADTSYVREKIGEALSILRAESGDLHERIRQVTRELEELQAAVLRGSVLLPPDENVNQELSSLEGEARALEKELSKVQEGLSRAREAEREKTAALRAAEAELRDLERELRTAEEARNAVSSKLERATYERERLATEKEELGKELKLAGMAETELLKIEKSHIEAHANPQDLFKKIERLRGKLEEVGGIDASVVKECQDTESRHAFLTKELEDLREAMKSTKELVATLDEQITGDFERGFKSINEGFNQYFRLIFGGGKAKLTYQELRIKNPAAAEAMAGQQASGEETDPRDEEVEYGVDIDVDLPRKRIKSLSMLSGGERALTSIAFLFAMVAVNPPPFLVLDETDAALDEANSAKYAKTLAELSQKSQLIIITHNRETMMHAGILYGVTMGDDGISKLLSIKLEEGEKYVSR